MYRDEEIICFVWSPRAQLWLLRSTRSCANLIKNPPQAAEEQFILSACLLSHSIKSNICSLKMYDMWSQSESLQQHFSPIWLVDNSQDIHCWCYLIAEGSHSTTLFIIFMPARASNNNFGGEKLRNNSKSINSCTMLALIGDFFRKIPTVPDKRL
jgi:hypothetical protein